MFPSTMSSVQYAKVASQDVDKYDNIATAVATATASNFFDESILMKPDGNRLAWEDTFFDEEEPGEIIAVFDFDYMTIESFVTSTAWLALGLSMFYPPLFSIAMLSAAPCFLNANVRWHVHAQHVAITRDGIRFVRAKRKTCWGLGCTDAGKSSKTVPFDQITDCDIEEPAGRTCCIKNVLTTINIDTASSQGNTAQHALKIKGLKDPASFRKLVWAMKRSNSAVPLNQTMPEAAAMVRGNETEAVASLLRDIRDELRELRTANHAVVRGADINASIGGDVELVASNIP